jgi:hypothetical protein
MATVASEWLIDSTLACRKDAVRFFSGMPHDRSEEETGENGSLALGKTRVKGVI